MQNNSKTPDWFGFITTVVTAFVLLVSWRTLDATQRALVATQEYNRLSLTPILRFEELTLPYDARTQVGLFIANYGSGVAIIDTFTVYLDEKPVNTTDSIGFAEALNTLGLSNRQDFPVKWVGQFSSAMPPGQVMLLFGVDKQDYSPLMTVLMNGAISRINVRVAYRSVYNENFVQYLRQPVR